MADQFSWGGSGAFNLVYTIEENECPTVLSEKNVKFRNKVIHQGMIPSRQDAIRYGQDVADVINPSFAKLKSSKAEIVERLVDSNLLSARKKTDEGVTFSTYAMPALLEWSHQTDQTPKTVSGWVRYTEKMRDRMVAC